MHVRRALNFERKRNRFSPGGEEQIKADRPHGGRGCRAVGGGTQRSPRTLSDAEMLALWRTHRNLTGNEDAARLSRVVGLRVAPRPRRPLRTFLLTDQD